MNLRSGSITGPILASTASVFLPDGFISATNFLFSSRVALSPGETYYLQPVVQSGDLWRINAGHLNYSGGDEYFQGIPLPTFDLWFREGIIIPEPSAAALALVGLCVALWRMRCARRKSER